MVKENFLKRYEIKVFVFIILLIGLLAVFSFPHSSDNSITGKSSAVPNFATDKVTKNVPIDGNITDSTLPSGFFKNPLTSSHLDAMQDGSVLLNMGSGYDSINVHDELWFAATSPSIETAVSADPVDKNYKTDVGMEVTEKSIYYYYLFDDAVDLTQISSDMPLKIKFLGKTIVIISAAADSVTALFGQPVYLLVGEEAEVSGHKVRLRDVGEGAVLLVIDDGVGVSVKENSVYTSSSGLRVVVDSLFYNGRKSSANLLVGTDKSTSFKDGDSFIDEDDGYWKWVISDLDAGTSTSVTGAGIATGPVLGVYNNFKVSSSTQKNPEPIKTKGCYDLSTVNPLLQLCIEGLSVENYAKVETTFEVVNLAEAGGNFGKATSTKVMKIVSNVDNSLELDLSELAGTTGYLSADTPTDTIYLMLNNTVGALSLVEVFYVDSDNKIKIAGNITLPVAEAAAPEFAYVEYESTTGTDVQLAMYNPGGAPTYGFKVAATELPTGMTDELWIIVDNWLATSFDGFETSVTYGGGGTDTDISTIDESLRTKYGITLNAPATILTTDVLTLEVPEDAARAVVSVIANPDLNVAGAITGTLYLEGTSLTGKATVVCGNGACEVGETISTCPGDCTESGGSTGVAIDVSDADKDGWTVALGDCNDTDASIYPGAKEKCLVGIDSDCDGLIAEADSDCAGIDTLLVIYLVGGALGAGLLVCVFVWIRRRTV